MMSFEKENLIQQLKNGTEVGLGRILLAQHSKANHN
jgi:hypothetical protein